MTTPKKPTTHKLEPTRHEIAVAHDYIEALRDRFACAAMAAYVHGSNDEWQESFACAATPEWAYDLADAMIKERRARLALRGRS